jgi:hypothetical protein
MTDIDGIEISQRSSLLPYRVCYPLGRKHGRYRAVKRRDFTTLLGGAAALSLPARAQELTHPIIGYLGSVPLEDNSNLAAFRKGLRESGYAELAAPAQVSSWHEAGQSLCDGCPQLVEADIRAFGRHSSFDPDRSLAGSQSRSAAVSCLIEVCYLSVRGREAATAPPPRFRTGG